MPTIVALENNYCVIDDVLAVLELSTAPDSLLQQRIHVAINQASRLIDDYCNTLFYYQDFSASWFDLRIKKGAIKLDASLFLPYPVSSITSIEEDNLVLSSSFYALDGLNSIYRVDSSGELVDWGTKIRVKAKFGYNLPGACTQAGFNTLPFLIRQQCAVFAAYLMGERKLDEKTKTKSGWENRQSPNVPVVTASVPGVNIDAFAFTNETNASTQNVTTYSGQLDIIKIPGSGAISEPVNNKNISLGWQAPISETEVQSGGLIGLVPAFEYRKLDSYRFLSVTGL